MRTLLNDEPCCKFTLKHDIKNYFRQFTKTLNISWQCVCMCVCACVCVVCLNTSTVKASSVCSDFLGILEGTDQQSCVEEITLDTSAKSLHLSF